MAGRLGQGDLIAGIVAATLLLLLLVFGMNAWLAIVLAIATYASVVLLRPQAARIVATDAGEAETRRAYQDALTHLTSIRANEARIDNPAVRNQVGSIADTLDRTVAAMLEDGNLEATPLFNDQLLEPFDALLAQYARLSRRGIRSADEAIARAETHDFPMIEAAATSFYEKVNRANVIDLAALGEVLELNIESMSQARLRRPAP